MGNHVSLPQSQIVWLAVMRTALEDVNKFAVLMNTLHEYTNDKPLMTYFSRVKEEYSTCRQVSTLSVENGNRVNRKHRVVTMHKTDEKAHQSQASIQFNRSNRANKSRALRHKQF